ncbi:two-component system, chemotaxis family, sensor kinase CheA [Mitsuaria sp. PDC51]|jgi:two-component system, chemotaxis family, sensor kinase CheA|uniref:chemotaxis protein CheA n=1 Tax=unclassified Roseateles TaxID=2626991 RepID=UPI0008F39B70|nr:MULTISPECIES: chemotaxis protein CheW [unclassified Roseateles]MBB3280112.1 two-component system chemotaxis sensor kinase CheA [Mitsuaria sp. BK037]MBB3292160.1 two-component system chemotaxis sensor kinase CheA [Mitsuaria sp. BK041]MBB3361377.1 two-component system chemotaxis sensor kinase CheA [Mitsuaria sp. BK045]SFR73513.1 two-component system, chemotaxis family, sensor kinase CheA [Mitsuaria sp. PDC51]
MGDMTSEGANLGAGIDLSQFYQVFFEEAGENLDNMEQLLLNLDIENPDDEQMNAIFRCAHSIKGGAATFGFNDVAELTHQMETLLDKLRRHELAPTSPMVDVLLQSGDALKAQLARHQGSGADAVDTSALLSSIRTLVEGGTLDGTRAPAAAPAPVAAPAPAPAAAAPAPLKSTVRQLELLVGPLSNTAQADNLVELFKEITDLGTIEPLDGGIPADGMRRFKVLTSSTDNDLLDLFTFHVSREQVKLMPLTEGFGFHEGAPGAPLETKKDEDPGYGFFDDAPGVPEATAAEAKAAEAAKASVPVPAAKPAAPARTDVAPRAGGGASPDQSTLRVSVEKVDQLINLVGELVITQAMLAQNSRNLDPGLYQQLASGLADLERNTRDLQESVMSIRMIPMSVVFNRFPRMLRDLAAKLGKKVELVTQGEATELDKGLVEKITDPLTHLVRNSCDHGIESPADRLAKGKPEQGTITLVASHQGGSIVIEVRDDGRGLNREKLIRKAREKGIDAPDSMTDQEVWGLIFAPGFSTADQVTDVSGRGVGMDVVKKNITSLGGTVEIDSAEGYGMKVSVRLPLTLAIMDGMSVGVGEEVYILPLSSVVESFQVQADTIKTVGGSGRVVEVRDEYMPVVELEQVFNVPRFDFEHVSSIMVVVEAEGGRVALLVDELLGQQQVVVKNLEANYRKVTDVSGATIMGDGRVALILDVGSLVRRSRH